jgi:hypothetical protein
LLYFTHKNKSLTKKDFCLGLSKISETSDGRSDGSGSSSARKERMLVKGLFSLRRRLLKINNFKYNLLQSVSTTSDASAAGVAVPDTGSAALDSVLTTEGAKVSGVLLRLKLLTLTTQR